MLLVQERCEARATHDERLVLPYAMRRKSRLRTNLVSGEEVGLFLERGTILRDGDYLRGNDGRIIKVEAASELVYVVRASFALTLVKAAYHLGNRHVPLQIGDGWLMLERDDVLKDMLLGLGADVVAEQCAFEPEPGAYAGGHSHSDHAQAAAGE
jgi:urease accessory protein